MCDILNNEGDNIAVSLKVTSTTEAEYIAATETVKEATWLRGLVIELGVPQATTMVFSDSQSVIHLTVAEKTGF